MKQTEIYGDCPMQMDDYGMDIRHYNNHGDCTISPTYGEDVEQQNDNNNDED